MRTVQEIQILQPNVNICHPPPCRACLSRRTVSKKIFFGSVILIIQLADEVQCYQDSIALWMHGLAEEEVAMCLAWIGFHEDSGSNCAKSLLGASFNFSVAFCEDKRMC